MKQLKDVLDELAIYAVGRAHEHLEQLSFSYAEKALDVANYARTISAEAAKGLPPEGFEMRLDNIGARVDSIEDRLRD